MTNFPQILRCLADARVDFIIVGGAAGTAHGSSRLTEDLDLVYGRNPENISRLVESLAPFDPYLRGAPPGLPFKWDTQTVASGLNFTLTTTLGPIDLLGEITGGGPFNDLVAHTVMIEVFGIQVLCLELEMLIRVKRAAGRPKDLEAIAELEAILEEQRKIGLR